MKAIELKQAKRSLSAYAKMAHEAPILLTSGGKPYVVMTRATAADVEDLAVSSSPAFRAIMERSDARYRAEGGLSTEEVQSRLAAPRGAERQSPPSMPSRRRRRVVDLEILELSHNPHFIEIVNRSWASYEKSGGVSFDEMRRRHVVERKPHRRKAR